MEYGFILVQKQLMDLMLTNKQRYYLEECILLVIGFVKAGVFQNVFVLLPKLTAHVNFTF